MQPENSRLQIQGNSSKITVSLVINVTNNFNQFQTMKVFCLLVVLFGVVCVIQETFGLTYIEFSSQKEAHSDESRKYAILNAH